MFEALLWLFIKHFICDFPLQTFPWIFLNKGRYCHLGGIVHAAIHGIGTALVLSFFLESNIWLFALADFLIHYHVDWFKMKLNHRLGYTATNGNGFWILLGLDQLAHHLTYFAIVYYAFKSNLT